MTKSEMNDVALLNVNQIVRAVSCRQYLESTKVRSKVTTGRMLFNEPNKDVLVIGTASHVLAYDVDNNKDLFYREVPDGVNTIIIGQLGANRAPLAICGGNCAIQVVADLDFPKSFSSLRDSPQVVTILSGQ